MTNPFSFMQGQQPQANPQIAQIKQMIGMLNSAQNPKAALDMLSQKNPKMAQVMQLVQGKNPQDVFYEMCRQQGVNPESILSQLR